MKHIILLFGILLGFVSCQMLEGEQGLVNTSEVGKLQLSVQTPAKFQSRAAGQVNTDNFEVIITGAGNFSRMYTASQIAAGVDLPVGEYSVRANTSGELQKIMDHAYFLGTNTVTVQKDLTTQAEILCKQQNMALKLNYGTEFMNAYQSWSITIDDGAENVLVFDEQEPNPSARYWLLGDATTVLTVNLIAQPKDENANVVKGRMTITKADADIVYDDDDETYKGGDSVVINVALNNEDTPDDDPSGGEDTPGDNPSEGGDTPEGNHSTSLGITVSTGLTFADTDETVKVPVVWETGEEPSPQPTPDGDNTEPTVVFTAASVTATAAGGPALDATITAPNGLKSILVRAEADGGFQNAIVDMEDSESLFLVSGHELVGDTLLPALFNDLGVQTSMPSEGDESYIFNIANFYQFLAIYGEGTTTFWIIVTDNLGKTTSGSVSVTITE